MSSTSQ